VTPPASGASRKCDSGEIRRRWRLAAVITGLFLVSNSVVVGLPLHGQVVSATSRLPLSRAHVLAWWRLESYGMESPRSRGLIQVLETRTDAEGRYFLPPWVRIKPFWIWNHQQSPSMLVFRPDYVPRPLLNDPDAQAKWLPMRFSYSQWSGSVIDLESRAANRAAFAAAVKHSVELIMAGAADSPENDCQWPRMRRTLMALNQVHPDALLDTRLAIRRCGQEAYFAWSDS
jgi:hypothetical protein